MISKLIAAVALALVISGCAGSGSAMSERLGNPMSDGPPASAPCQASG